jgi:hypothetical protein
LHRHRLAVRAAGKVGVLRVQAVLRAVVRRVELRVVVSVVPRLMSPVLLSRMVAKFR